MNLQITFDNLVTMNKYEEFIPATKIALSGINKNNVIFSGKTRTIRDVLKTK